MLVVSSRSPRMALLTTSVGKISFKVHKKPIFPRPVFDRSGLNLGKVQVIEDKSGTTSDTKIRSYVEAQSRY